MGTISWFLIHPKCFIKSFIIKIFEVRKHLSHLLEFLGLSFCVLKHLRIVLLALHILEELYQILPFFLAEPEQNFLV